MPVGRGEQAVFTESFLNVGSMFIPGGGAAGAGMKIIAGGGKAASWGAKVVNAAGKIADFGLPGGGWIVAGGVKVFNVGSDAVRVLDDVVAAGRNVPGARLVPSLDDLVPARKPVSEMCHFDESVTSGRSATAGVDTPVKPQPGIENVSVKARPGGVDVSAMGKGIEAPGGGRPGPVGDGVRSSSLVDDVSAGGKPSVSEISESPTARGGASGSGTRPEVEGPQALRDGDVESRPGGGESRDEGGSGQRSDSDGGDHTSRGTADEPTRHVDQAGDGIRHSGGDASIDRAPDVDVMPERGSGASSGEVPEGKPTHDRYGREYKFREDGRAYIEGDPPGTHRSQRNGQLYKLGHSGSIKDVNPGEWSGREAAKPIEVFEQRMGDETTLERWNDKGTDYETDLKARNAIQEEHLRLDREYRKLGKELGVDMKDLKKSTYADTLDNAEKSGQITSEQRLASEAILNNKFKEFEKLCEASQELGERATDARLASKGETPLFGAEDRAAQGDADQIGVRSDKSVVSVYEAKGIGGKPGDRLADGIRVDQGSTGYLNEILRLDERIAQRLQEYAENHPGSVFSEAFEQGSLKIEYEMVQALTDGRVKVTRYVLDYDRIEVPKAVRGG